MKKLLLPCLFLLVFSGLEAQFIREFSQDTTLFLQELDQVFLTSLLEEEEQYVEDFKETWAMLEHDLRVEIMEIADLMRKRSCRPRPQYIMYVEILEEFLNNPSVSEQFDEWLRGYRYMMEDEKTLLRQINSINTTVYNLLTQNLIYDSPSLKWQLGEPSYNFIYDDKLMIKIEGVDLIGLSGYDLIVINEVTGVIDPVAQHFYGTDGTVYWERAGLDRQSVYAELSRFDFQLKKPEYQADSVIFHHEELLGQPAMGRLQDRITQVKTLDKAQYPKFNTYQSSYLLEQIVEGIDYRGAIAMQGANLAGMEAEGKLARLDVFYDDTVRMSLRSHLFVFSPSAIISNNVETSIYISDDSIYHPDLILNYNIENELLRLFQSKDYNSQGPYSDTYHRIDMSVDEINWNRKEDILRMQAALGASLGNGLFESFDFFNMQFYSDMQGMEYQHPLVQLWSFANMLGGETFSAKAYADYLGYAAYMIRQQLMQLSKIGFVYFDFDNDEVTLRPKLYDYIDASLMKRDYDVIRFVSRTQSGTENAILDLRNYDLTINGIPTIFLSDSQNVKLVPTNNSIIMKRNRDFQFDGVIDAGLFKFYGKNFFFEYENFRINLQNIDSLSISAMTGERDQYGNQLTTTLENKIENITGELLIDAPFNKSGLTSFPEYPIFTSRENSYVYFDENSIQDGVYERDRFFFELYPFSIDSLDNFRREAMRLEGTFVSADILPKLDMEMSLRPDNSLGFYMTTEDEGIPVFGGNATFFNDIEMSSAGLRGYGSLDYISSTTWSDDFLFHPDSLFALSRRFLEREKEGAVSYPYVENTTADVRYYPRMDEMHINRVDSVFDIFNNQVDFGGDLALSPNGLKGNGALSFEDARFESEVFSFKTQQTFADSAGAKLRKDKASDFTLITNNVNLDIDLIRREGEFISNDKYSLIELPANLYETRLNQVNWFMDENNVVMTQSEYLAELDVDIGIDTLKTNGPVYVSKHPQQDSLHFTAPKTTFDYSNNILMAEKVPFLEIGDAYIFPANSEVQVLEKATIKPLKQAQIMANKSSRYHMMHDANLIVDSRNHYQGSASYDYYDEFDNKYTLRFEQIDVDTSIYTYGNGQVAEEDSFRLSPYFDYQGEVRIDAREPFLTFAGGVRLTHDCNVGRYWMKFETEIDPDSVIIPVESRMQNLDLNNIYAGTLKARDSTHVYPTFLSGRKDYFDRNISYSDGYLYYDKAERTYEIAGAEKLRDMSVAGNYLSLETDTCRLYSEGRINLQLDYGRIKMTTVGEVSHDIESNELKIRTIMGLDFHFAPEALDLFGRELDSLPDMSPVDLTSDFYKLGVRNLVDSNALADKLENEIGLYGNYTEIPDSMQFSLMFNDLNLEWTQETRSYRYNGEVGIGTIGNVQVNKKVKAYIEFVERGSGDVFDIYLMVDKDTWYYMAYSPGGFQVLSSNRDFNAIILEKPDKERTLKSRGRQPSYIYSLASTRRLALFRDRFLLFEEERDQ